MTPDGPRQQNSESLGVARRPAWRTWSLHTEDRTELLRLASRHANLAEELGTTTQALEVWRVSGKGLPRRVVRGIEFLAYGASQDDVLAASGLPTCNEAEALAKVLDESDDAMRIQAGRQLEQHAERCPLCQRRIRLVESKLGPPPAPPFGLFMRVVGQATRWIMSLPNWLRPAAAGAGFVAMLLAFRLVFAVPAFIAAGSFSLSDLAEGGIALLAALAAGSSGGFAYSASGPLVRFLGEYAVYGRGVFAVAGYLAGLHFLGPAAFGEQLIPLDDAVDLWIFGIMSIAMGLAFGHGLRSGDSKRAGATSDT